MSKVLPAAPRLFNFVASNHGTWRVEQSSCITGEPLPVAERISVTPGALGASQPDVLWSLRGITSHERYVIRDEKNSLLRKQEGLGRAHANRAALIPIRKNAAWWALPQDERRHILEEQSQHIAIGMKYLPAIARRLHHCRDLGDNEPFDFITWFEFAPADGPAFDQLVATLRASPEWRYVERETDIRLSMTPD